MKPAEPKHKAGQAYVCESDVAAARHLFAGKVPVSFGLCMRSSLTLVGIAASVFQRDMKMGSWEKVSKVN